MGPIIPDEISAKKKGMVVVWVGVEGMNLKINIFITVAREIPRLMNGK